MIKTTYMVLIIRNLAICTGLFRYLHQGMLFYTCDSFRAFFDTGVTEKGDLIGL